MVGRPSWYSVFNPRFVVSVNLRNISSFYARIIGIFHIRATHKTLFRNVRFYYLKSDSGFTIDRSYLIFELKYAIFFKMLFS